MAIGISGLNTDQIDVLKEIGNIGAGNAATALASMLNKKVDMSVPKAKILEFKDVSETLGGAEILVVGILFKVSGDLTGNIMFILRYEAAVVLVTMLMGKPVNLENGFDEIELSALKEIGNILAGSYLSAMAGLTHLKIVPSVPDLAIDMAGAILKKDGKKDLAIICSEDSAAAAGVFTTNKVKGHSLQVTVEHIKSGYANAIVINSGNANACVGEQGYKDAKEIATITAELLECNAEDILVGSTGVISLS